MTKQEARAEILKQRQRVNGKDSATDALIARVEKEIELAKKPQGGDLYLAKLQRAFDGQTEEDPEDDNDPEEDSSTGRDAWLERFPKVCEEFNREYRHNLKVHRTMARNMLKEY